MRKLATIAVATMALLAALPVVSAGATPPSAVEIVVPGFEGPFTATGAAVDDGVICGSGDVATTFTTASGFQSGFRLILTVGKHFECDDSSGTFDAKLQVNINFNNGEVRFNWVITDGTGDYVDLHGSGRGFVDGGTTDVYSGGMHID